MNVTLKDLRKAGACYEGYNRVVCALKGIPFNGKVDRYMRYRHEEPISVATIIDSNGLADARWALRCVVGHDRELRLFAVWCARQVPQDSVCTETLNVAERYANGQATDEERSAAESAAESAARSAAWAAAESAAWAAARSAAWAAAESAAESAAWAAARSAAWAAQADMLRKMCKGEAPWNT